jgi:aspartyl-tRNA(Asn)/glutamyl-tRNA(Gln) amidotransferase subunit A
MAASPDCSARELRERLVGGALSVREATEGFLRRIDEADGRIGAFNEVHRERALQRAAELDAEPDKSRLPLFGIPTALKDNLCTDYGRTTCSSRMLAGYRSPYTAAAVSKLEAAGAVVLGKTNMDEFAMGSSTENSAFGVTRNPWDLSRVPGGSSGGSAAAVSAGLCAAALGSDTGGSIRQPAAFCGAVGLKPTYGRVSRWGLVAFGSSLDQIGPIARDVRDCALVAGVIAGHDPRDSTSVPRDVPHYLETIEEPIEGLTVGLPREYYTDALEETVRGPLEAAARAFRAAGAEIVEVGLPHGRIDRDASGTLSSFAVACYYIIAMAEASSNLSRFDGVHYGHRSAAHGGDIVELYARSRSEALGEEVRRRIMLGTYTLSSGYYDAYYLKALKVRRLIASDFERAFRRCDLLLAPVTPTPAFRIGENIGDPLTMYLQDVYTLSVNLAGLPALALPCGVSEQGLPVGMQLIGPAFSEAALLRAGRLYEKQSGFARPTPPALPPEAPGVCGAKGEAP